MKTRIGNICIGTIIVICSSALMNTPSYSASKCVIVDAAQAALEKQLLMIETAKPDVKEFFKTGNTNSTGSAGGACISNKLFSIEKDGNTTFDISNNIPGSSGIAVGNILQNILGSVGLGGGNISLSDFFLTTVCKYADEQLDNLLTDLEKNVAGAAAWKKFVPASLQKILKGNDVDFSNVVKNVKVKVKEFQCQKSATCTASP